MKFLNFPLMESGKQSSFDSFEAKSFISLTKTDVSKEVLCKMLILHTLIPVKSGTNIFILRKNSYYLGK